MNQSDPLVIANSQNRMRQLEDVHKKFLAHLGTGGASTKFSSALSVANQTITVDACGKTLAAVPRIVRHGQSDFAVEYTFTYTSGQVSTPIWRFYLTANGLIVSSLVDDASRLGDFNNPYLLERLLTEANAAALASELFAPSEPIIG